MSANDRYRPGLYQMLAVTPLLSAASAYRAGVAHANVWYKNAPGLWNMWFDAVEPGPGQLQASVDLRENVFTLMEESSTAVSKELDRGIHDIREYSKRRGTDPPGGS